MNDDTLSSLGSVIPGESLPPRDAVHIAVVAIIAKQQLAAGEKYYVNGKYVGIVDPFLFKEDDSKWGCKPGDKVWIYLRPMTIRALRHDWDHESFPHEEFDKSGLKDWSRQWIDGFVKPYRDQYPSVTTDAFIKAAVEHIAGTGDAEDFPMDDNDNTHTDAEWKQFWLHVSIYSGLSIDADETGSFFKCCA